MKSINKKLMNINFASMFLVKRSAAGTADDLNKNKRGKSRS